MNIIKVTTNNDENARLLVQMLKSISFVVKVENVKNKPAKKLKPSSDLQELLDKTPKNKFFKDIKDPVEWQKKMRDEWS